MRRVFWVDAVKAICMISVYLIHSGIYYDKGEIDYTYVLIPFYVNAFFFVSGYLFFNKYSHLSKKECKLKPINECVEMVKGTINIVFKLVIPTLLFSSIIYLPKVFFHGNSVSVIKYVIDVFGGISFWFTSALVVSQLILLIMLCFLRNNRWCISITFLFFIVGVYLSNNQVSTTPESYFPWFYRTGIVYTFIMTIGGLFIHCEHIIDKYINSILLISFISYSIIMFYAWNTNLLICLGLSGRCNIFGFIEIFLGISLIVFIAKKMHGILWIEFIGRNSIIFYFFSGVLPAAVGSIAKRLPISKNYGITILVTVLSVTIGYCITYIVVRFMPFLMDLRKLKSK